jgi:uncharacterized membrane protein
MILLILGLIVFIGVHLVPTQVSTRGDLSARFGEGAYKGLLSLVAFVGLALIIYGFGEARYGRAAIRSCGIRRAGPDTSP